MDLKDLKFIAQGFINATKSTFGSGNKEIEKRAEERYKTCLSCPTISPGKGVCSKTKGGCGCPLAMRTRSDKGCPKGKW